YEHTGEVPFDSVMVNGMVLDENREAMSKSKGNVVTPAEVLEKFPVDAARYWAAGTSIGDDFPFKENDLEAGERLLQKLWNASKLVDQLAPADPDQPEDLAAIDRWLLASLDETIDSITEKLAAYEFSKARDELRTFFWNTFCDDYLEIAKQREDDSAAYALSVAHRTFLKLFAPFLPHVTEEIWQARYADGGSIHTTDWPEPRGYNADIAAGQQAMAVIGALRRYKTEQGLALNADLDRVEVFADVSGFAEAISGAMHVAELVVRDDAPEIGTEIADIDLDYATIGPKYGDQVGDIEAAIASGDYEIDGDRLHAGDITLEGDEFDVREEHTYAGEGELIETEGDLAVVVGN
ncbi:MAG: class I tRNA ligase family protein, partial [Halorhabdus sp.]